MGVRQTTDHSLPPSVSPALLVPWCLFIAPSACTGVWQDLMRRGLLALGCLLPPFSTPTCGLVDDAATLEGAWWTETWFGSLTGFRHTSSPFVSPVQFHRNFLLCPHADALRPLPGARDGYLVRHRCHRSMDPRGGEECDQNYTNKN